MYKITEQKKNKITDNPFAKYDINKKKKPLRGIHSPLHEVVAKLRREFNETEKKGVGSFGYYLRMLKPVPVTTIDMWLKEVQNSTNLDSPLAKCKVFWWKYKQRKLKIKK